METSQAIGKISEALAKAQGQMKPAVFDASNPHFKSKYATLAAIMEVARPVLSANGIAVVQGTSVDGDPLRVHVTTILMHVSGEWIKDTLSVKPAVDNAQGVGSAITYLRRYALSALVGIVADEDDDGESAVGRPVDKPANHQASKLVEMKKAEAARVNPVVAKVAPTPARIQDRVARIREIFTLSAKRGQTPKAMKDEIGQILGLGRPIKGSAEIPDDKIEVVAKAFSDALAKMPATAKKEVA